MSLHSGRLEAFMWMHDTVHNWGNHSIDSPRSSAIFQLGPGGDEDTCVHVARMMMYLAVPWPSSGTRSHLFQTSGSIDPDRHCQPATARPLGRQDDRRARSVVAHASAQPVLDSSGPA
jgi:hypothetical protein